MLSVKVTCCSCLLSSEPAPSIRAVSSACWKCPCRVFEDVMQRLIVFDLDGTLAPSKSSIDTEMVNLLNSLLAIVKVAVISGGAWPQFEQQVLARLRPDVCLKNLSLLPTCGTKFYRHDVSWKLLYSEDFTAAQRSTIVASLQRAIVAAD